MKDFKMRKLSIFALFLLFFAAKA